MVDIAAPGSAPGADSDADALAVGDTGANPENNIESADAGEEGTEGPVPYARFLEKVRDNEGLATANAQLRQTLQSLVEKPAAPAPIAAPVETAPPEGLTPDQKLQWYLRTGAREHTPAIIDSYLKENLGMSVAELKETIGGLREEAGHSVQARFNLAVTDAGLKPSAELRHAVVGIMKSSGVSIEDAVTTLKGLAPPPVSPPPGQPGRDMLQSGLTGTRVVTDKLPSSFAEANEMARNGQSIPHIDTADILARGADGKG